MGERFPADATSGGTMRQEVYDEGHLRRYLLGELNEEEQQAVEERLLTDDESFDLLLAAEEELIDDYASGALSAEQRGRFESFFLSTSDRQRKLSFAMALRRYITAEAGAAATQTAPERSPRVAATPARVIAFPSVWWKHAFSNPYLRMAAAVVIVVGLGLGIWRVFFYQSEVAKGMAAFAKAYRVERPTEARISGLNYAPLNNTRGAEQAKVDELQLDLAERILLEQVAEHPSAAAHHALGRLYLAQRRFDIAIAQFDEALKVDPNNAHLHSDYAAALLEKGKASQAEDSTKGAVEFSQALDHVGRALDLDGSLLDARFNLGLAREALGLTWQAEEAWRQYLEKDSHSPWANEARSHLDRLQERKQRTESGRQNVIEDMLNAYTLRDDEKIWALLCSDRQKVTSELIAVGLGSAGDPSNQVPIAALAYAGEIDVSKSGDRYTADLAVFCRSASEQRQARASTARNLLRQAEKSYQEARLEESLSLYSRAQQAFSSVRDKSEATVAACGIGLSLMEMARTEQSAVLFESLARECEASNYRWLRARALFYHSAIQFARNEYSMAIASAKQACSEAEAVADQSCIVFALDALVEYHRTLANQAECFSEISFSLPRIETSSLGSIALGRHYGILALALNSFGFHSAATDSQREALRYALMIPDDFASLSVAYAHLGLMCAKLHNLADAFKNLDMSYAQAEAHASERAGQEKMAYAAFQMGNLRRETGDYLGALASYNRAIELYRSLNHSTFLYQAYKGRLVCYVGQNKVVAARQELAEIMSLIDKQRTNIFEDENRNNFFDVEQSVYDLGIKFEYEHMGEARKAFEYAESSRARSLLDSSRRVIVAGRKSNAPSPATRPLSIEDIQTRIPIDARLLMYAVIEDGVLIWVVSHSGFESTQVPCSQTALSETVSSYVTALQRSTSEDERSTWELGRELYRKLIAPVESYLGGSKSLYIVPDKVLDRLSWDALISGDRFLLEDYVVTVSPSATLFAVCTDLAEQKGGSREERILSVGNPSFDTGKFPKLDPLPDSINEATDIAEMYQSRAPLVGREAREQTIRDELLNADVAHFATHCVIDERSSEHSCLLLAKELGSTRPETDGVLEAREICEMKLPRVRLAVLSACQTGVERYYRGEGMIGMARAFLVARVPIVVASLWPVDSRLSAELMVRFHQHRKLEGRSTAESLTLAKRSLLLTRGKNYGRPCWAAFETIGGHAGF